MILRNLGFCGEQANGKEQCKIALKLELRSLGKMVVKWQKLRSKEEKEMVSRYFGEVAWARWA